jgi:choline dehydrogenase-like flavoprotein
LVARTGPNKGKRSYAARGYFETNQHRPNLKVLCEALSTNVVLEGNVAKGVAFLHNGTKHTVNVKKEVILSCGVVQSPQLLELSGIGDPEVLKAAGVECKVENLGVGNNFQDHCLSMAVYQLAPGIMSLDALQDPKVMEDAQKTLTEKQGGPLTGISSCQGFFPYKVMASDEELKETIQSLNDTKFRTPYEKQQIEQIITHLESDSSANLQMLGVCVTGGYEHGVEDQSLLFPEVDPSKGVGCTLVVCLQVGIPRFDDA